ncbi:DUF2889 domain-containing protein [Cupriavidus sp. CuC1]|uniref:DUF2889 domain-containing protein n=1 Tax=Cupriavidus sp. CuC1 TaxID=3373131 RepID=UPI0037D685E7
MFRRRIIICSQRAGTQTRVRAALEDDFHHFRVEIASAEGRVTRLDGAAPRQPYTLCANAVARLDALLGMPLSPTAHEVTRVTDPTEQCTHLFELAGLAVAAAARGTALRQYDIEVPVRQRGRTRPRLWRDGAELVAWEVLGSVIEGPLPYAGVDLYHGMARWALTALSVEDAEAALVLRRATVISLGRGMPLDAQVHAKPSGNCYSQQPRRATEALRVVGSTLDFAGTPERLCADDLGWLSFKEHADGC